MPLSIAIAIAIVLKKAIAIVFSILLANSAVKPDWLIDVKANHRQFLI